MFEFTQEFNQQEQIVEAPQSIRVIHLDENKVVKNFIEVMSIDDMPNCIEWQDGVNVGDTYHPDTNTFTKYIPSVVIPERVTRRQARQALLMAGLLDHVDTAIAAIPDETQRRLAQIEWEDSQEFVRSRPLVISIGQALGLDSEGLDALFVQAGNIP